MKNIWKSLKKPIFILAPMDDVTDTVFRQIIGELASPDLYFTEFTSIDGITSEKGFEPVSKRLQFTQKEKPIIAQIWGNDPEKFFKSSQIIAKMGFDGIDINMGCPEKSVMRRGMCSALINNPKLAGEIIQAVKKGGKLPTSVKTRLGIKEIKTEEWISFLLKQNLDALIIHGRTVKEMSKVPAHWGEIEKAVKLRNQLNPETLIIGNGDVSSYQDGLDKVKEYGVDGIMIGTGIFKNLWIFDKTHKAPYLSPEQRLNQLLKHTKLFVDTWGEKKSFAILKKFFKCYLSDFEGASQIRAEFMNTNSLDEAKILANKFMKLQG